MSFDSRAETSAPASSLSTDAHNEAQRRYYRRDDLRRLRPGRTPTVERHLDRTLAATRLRAGEPVLEIGAGLGRFTSLLAERGHPVIACDLSRELLDQLEARGFDGVETLCCDAAEIGARAGRRFRTALGFFVLHHLPDLPAFFRGLATALEPGAEVAFCEPNAYHLPYYVQISLAPGMSWRGDGGVVRMRPGPVFSALRAAGFVDPEVERYGFLPPVMSNRRVGRRIERWLEAPERLGPLRAYQVFRARMGDRDGSVPVYDGP